MASNQQERREEARLMLLRFVSESPDASTREIAAAIGVSNGSAYYLLKALIEKGFVKAYTFANAKSKYFYVLTPEGSKQRLGLTERFLARKRMEYKVLRDEIQKMERELQSSNGVEGLQSEPL
ncbi:MAG: MarR family EPS-associated transcriptional regulator [Rhodothermales bacterium]